MSAQTTGKKLQLLNQALTATHGEVLSRRSQQNKILISFGFQNSFWLFNHELKETSHDQHISSNLFSKVLLGSVPLDLLP